MKKPHLVILERTGDCPVKGGCSSCEGMVFQTGTGVGVAAEHHAKLERLFRDHFRKMHMHEDASQAAARIVRKANG